MTASEALARTMLLMRSTLRADVTDAVLLDALTSVKIELFADEHNLESAEGQHALVSATLLIARSGAKCFLRAPNVRLKGIQAPLTEPRLLDALLDVGQDLIPGQRIEIAGRGQADMAVILGDSSYSGSAQQALRLSGDAWEGRLDSTGSRWFSTLSPFGALAAAGLAAGEAYKVAMRHLRTFAAPGPYDDYFRACNQATVALAPPGTPAPRPALGRFDMVSGGAIVQAAIYALLRIPGATANARVIEQDTNDLTNINRYALLRRSGVGVQKAEYLSNLDLGGLEIEAVPLRYEAPNRARIGPLAGKVLIGVDNVESRWAVQEERPAWLGIGATEDYLAFLSVHGPGLPCAECVHDGGSATPGAVPTTAFVSHWGGLALAAAFARARSGIDLPAHEQVMQFACLQLGAAGAFWKMRAVGRRECPNGCGLIAKPDSSVTERL